jgi:phosphoribosylanthranilate isomerase
MTRVKICGITNPEDALMAVRCGADALGFVFAQSSRQITPEAAKGIIELLPPLISTVGVFVDQPARRVAEIAQLCHLDAIQLHGEEPPAYCREFTIKVIKAFRVRDQSIANEVASYDVDAYLLDSPTGGGTGRKFDWDLIPEIDGRIILAGGLSPANVRDVIRKIRPYGVDVSSGVERIPGQKDHRLMEEFVRNVRQCDRND